MNLIARDLCHIWHPCMQMKDFEQFPPLVVQRAQGSYLYTDKGPIIDAISSWWCKSLGHNHPHVITAIKEQLEQFEHVITANMTYRKLVELAEKLTKHTQKQHVFFASDGSSSIEIALKLALQAQKIKGAPERNEFIALQNGYHGETMGALSVSNLDLYTKNYHNYGVNCHFIRPPYVLGQNDSVWGNAVEHWEEVQQVLEKLKVNACALIVEPLVQGAGGMRCYSLDFFQKLADWAQNNAIYLIADEIMTGLGRTGKWLACHYATLQPDIICLSKGLTSGTLPLSCVLIDHNIYELFYDDYEKGKSFLHSHTFSGNALAVSAALATLEIMEKESINDQAQKLGLLMQQQFGEIAAISQKLTNVRSLGAIVAADLVNWNNQRLGYALYQEAINNGALLRPLGNTLYWLPPLNTDASVIGKLAEITLKSITAIYR